MSAWKFRFKIVTTSIAVSALLGQTAQCFAVHGNYTNLALNDYFIGQSKFTPPPYRDEFSDHLNALEIEYLEFFKQLAPVNEPPVALSRCLEPGPGSRNATAVAKRGWNPLRKLAKYLKHKIDDVLGRPPAKPVYAKYCAATSLTINVYYHVVVSNDANLGLVTRQMVTDQTAFLNTYYENLAITFVEQDLNYRINPTFARSASDLYDPYKQFTRSGDYADLNVWIKEEIPGANPGEVLLGYAPFPDATYNAWERTFDGVVMIISTLPGSTGDVKDQGTNLVHEVGHWLGLRHVFDETQANDTACTNTNADTIQDTKQYPAHRPEIFSNSQVPCGETAAEQQYNFMSYSGQKGGDGYGFVTGQKARIYSRFLGVRRGIKNMNGKDCLVSPIPSTRRRDTEKPLPPDVLSLLREDGRNCRQDELPPDISLDPSPDAQYPEYPILPIEPAKRRPVPPPDPLAPWPAGSARCIADAPPRYRLPGIEWGKEGTQGVCTPQGTCSCPPGAGTGTGTDPGDDGKSRPGEKPGEDTSGCPAPCNPHNNRCHIPTAQTCVYPAPLASVTPRAYCACRPGYKSSHGGDTSKNWRLAVPGIEAFVWVAEGVVCDQLCDSNRCEEVPVIKGACL